MIKITSVFLDGTPLTNGCTVAEFSPLHAVSAISWAVKSDKPNGRQVHNPRTLLTLVLKLVLASTLGLGTGLDTKNSAPSKSAENP